MLLWSIRIIKVFLDMRDSCRSFDKIQSLMDGFEKQKQLILSLTKTTKRQNSVRLAFCGGQVKVYGVKRPWKKMVYKPTPPQCQDQTTIQIKNHKNWELTA